MTELIISQVVNGLVLGFLYVLIAIGLSIIFGMLGVVNFAHGVFFALGAYFALTLQDNLGPWAIVLAPLGVGILGMLIEMSLMRPLYGKEPLLGLFMTFGIALFTRRTDPHHLGRGRPAFQSSGFSVRLHHLGTGARYQIPAVRAGADDHHPGCAVVVFARHALRPHHSRRQPRSGNGQHARHQPEKGIYRRVRPGHGGCRHRRRARRAALERGAIDVGGRDHAGLRRRHDRRPRQLRRAVISGLLVGISVALSIQFWPAASTAVMYALMILVLLVRPRGLLGESWERFE